MTLQEQREGKSAGRAVRLGLIGDSIRESRSPDLHRIGGQLCGLEVSYELLIPPALGKPFEDVLAECAAQGFRGVNVTYPYKERVIQLVSAQSPDVTRIGSANTVVFAAEGARSHNTDYSGFIAAYRATFGETAPGRVALVGAGGVGRAVGFALAALGASEIRIFDAEDIRAAALNEALSADPARVPALVTGSVAEAVAGADGLVNCTPVGMFGKAGTAIAAPLIGPQRWAFDAVYTPVETDFLVLARAAGLQVLSGFELFFQQGIDAFRLFTGQLPPDLDALRRRLGAPEAERTRD